ncbi:hypothetical protein REPUB_Repub17cG0176800 [Reevesia pubescens]
MHACCARRLGAVDNKNIKLEKKLLHFSIKAKSTSLKEIQSIKEESIEESHADDDTQKLEDIADQVKSKSLQNEKEKAPGAVQANKSLVSVSWRVPHRKRGKKHPGFNLDYSPPKTHPPSHN